MMIILVLIILLMLTSSEIADYFFWYSDYNTPESDLVYNIVSNSRKKKNMSYRWFLFCNAWTFKQFSFSMLVLSEIH